MSMVNRSSLCIVLVILSIVIGFPFVFRDVMFPFVFGAFLAYSFVPIVDRFCVNIPRRVLSALITLTFICIFVFLFLFIAPHLEKQLIELVRTIPKNSAKIIGVTNKILSEFGINQLDSSILQRILVNKVDVLIGIILNLLSYSNVITNFFSCLIIVPVTMFYMLKDWDRFVDAMLYCIPMQYSKHIIRLGQNIRSCLWKFFKGQSSAAIILAVYYSLCLFALSLNKWGVLGVLTGVMSFIPFVGAVCCGITAFCVGVFTGFSFCKLVIIVAIYTVGPLLESYFITPRFVGNEVGLHPLWILFAFFAGVQIYGIIGVAIAIPCAAVIAETIRYIAKIIRRDISFKV